MGYGGPWTNERRESKQRGVGGLNDVPGVGWRGRRDGGRMKEERKERWRWGRQDKGMTQRRGRRDRGGRGGEEERDGGREGRGERKEGWRGG